MREEKVDAAHAGPCSLNATRRQCVPSHTVLTGAELRDRSAVQNLVLDAPCDISMRALAINRACVQRAHHLFGCQQSDFEGQIMVFTMQAAMLPNRRCAFLLPCLG